jgi:Flp pilus assembly protein CpaB
MKVRGLTLIVSVLLAAVAAGAVFMYVRGVQDETRAEQERVSVIVAKQDIPPGSDLNTLISAGAFTTTEIPRISLVRGVVTSLQQLQGQESSSPILAGEQISSARLRGEAELGGGVLGIPPNHKAVSLPLEAPRALSGVLRTGDHVSVYATFQEAAGVTAKFNVNPSAGTASGQVTAVPGLTITVVPDVQVLQVASPTSSGIGTSAEGSETVVVTMALEPRDAQRVIFAMERGEVWLGLLSPSENGKPERPVSFAEVAR